MKFIPGNQLIGRQLRSLLAEAPHKLNLPIILCITRQWNYTSSLVNSTPTIPNVWFCRGIDKFVREYVCVCVGGGGLGCC